MMSNGIAIRILGDFGPFSRIGKSIGYQIWGGKSSFLIDCGAPLFQEVGGHEIKLVDGLIVTHCHDDHKRWFTDLALFHMYAQDVSQKLTVLTSEDIYDELMTASAPALDRSLSTDSKKVIDIAHEQYIDYRPLGPRAKFRIVSRYEESGKRGLYVIDNQGNEVGPERAKIVISSKSGRPRMLFKDPDYREWVEPESFYSFSSSTFYEDDKNLYRDAEGLTIEAVKAPVWHGVPAIGLRITTGSEKILFSSDTIHNANLWKQLFSERRTQRLSMSPSDFESSTMLFGDINDYIQRTWSEERYTDALKAFEGVVVIHDVAMCNSIVHTDYEMLGETVLEPCRTILTHSPDRITSEWVLCDVGKKIKISEDKYYEVVDDKLYHMNADLFMKDSGKYYVGYKNNNGRYGVYEEDGLLSVSEEETQNGRPPKYKVDLYEDISGRYFPKIEEDHAQYLRRKDGKVERVEFTVEGSRGVVVEDERSRLQQIAVPEDVGQRLRS
jgi:ribonuclease BN (tRNA processing enzyme)